MVNPWLDSKGVHVRDVTADKEIIPPTKEGILSFSTIPGHTYYLERLNKPVETFKQKTFVGKKNLGPKYFGGATLGKPRLW